MDQRTLRFMPTQVVVTVIRLSLFLMFTVKVLSVSLLATAAKHLHIANHWLPVMHSGDCQRLLIDGRLIHRRSLAITVRRVQLDIVQSMVSARTNDCLAASCVGNLLHCT